MVTINDCKDFLTFYDNELANDGCLYEKIRALLIKQGIVYISINYRSKHIKKP